MQRDSHGNSCSVKGIDTLDGISCEGCGGTVIRDTSHREFRYHRHRFNDPRETKLNRGLEIDPTFS